MIRPHDVRFRPMPTWPHTETPQRRHRPFMTSGIGMRRERTPWSKTMDLLARELNHLNASNVLIGLVGPERSITRDGLPRADATFRHPGVELSFDSKYGRLTYATDTCDDWRDNVRSIALGLESLRAVDRYGVSTRGQQYAGWKALPPGVALGPVTMDAKTAWSTLRSVSGKDMTQIPAIKSAKSEDARRLYRAALRAAHPDTGGDRERFELVQSAGRTLGLA